MQITTQQLYTAAALTGLIAKGDHPYGEAIQLARKIGKELAESVTSSELLGPSLCEQASKAIFRHFDAGQELTIEEPNPVETSELPVIFPT